MKIIFLMLLFISSKEEVRTGLWNAVKNISPESVKNAAVNFYEEKKQNYTSDKPYIVRHTVGKDAVQIASVLCGGFAKKGKKFTEAFDETGGELGRGLLFLSI